MLKKFFVVLLLMAQCIASSAFFTAETEEAEIIQCRSITHSATPNTTTIFRQQQSVQIINGAEKLSFIESITAQTLDSLRIKLAQAGFYVTSVSILKLPNNKKYHIDSNGWLTAY